MRIGSKKSVTKYVVDGNKKVPVKRTGTVVYIHPRGVYYILEFTGAEGEKYRESYYLPLSRARLAEKRPYGRRQDSWTPEEEEYILRGLPTATIVGYTGRSRRSVDSHKHEMRARGQIA